MHLVNQKSILNKNGLGGKTSHMASHTAIVTDWQCVSGKQESTLTFTKQIHTLKLGLKIYIISIGCYFRGSLIHTKSHKTSSNFKRAP